MHVLMSLYMAASNLERSGTTLTSLMDHETTGHCGTHHWEWRIKMFVHVLCGCVWPMYLGGADENVCACMPIVVWLCLAFVYLSGADLHVCVFV